MKNLTKKVLSVLLAMILAFGVIPMAGVSATDLAEDTTPYEREVKTKGTGWVFYTSGELVITSAYKPVYPSPWASYARDVLAISIEEGVTTIGEGEFEGCCSIRTAYIPATVATIGDAAFFGCESLTLGAPDATVFFGGENFTNWDVIKYYFPEGIVTAHKHAHKTELRNINVFACSAKGTKGDTYCATCDTLLEIGAPVTKKAHNPEEIWTVAKDATCGNEGELVLYCKLCGEVAQSKAIPATGDHDFSVFVKRTDKDSDCTKAGTKDEVRNAIFKCANCDATKIMNDTEARTHVWVVKGTNITEEEWMAEDSAYCANGGVANMVCKNCSQTKQIKKEHVSASGEYIVDYDSTCQAEGRLVQICDNCGEKFNSKTIAKKDCYYIDVYPNCMEGEDRTIYEVCIYCGDKKAKLDDAGKEIKWVDDKTGEPFLSHQGNDEDPDANVVVYGEDRLDHAVSCVDNAYEVVRCSICLFEKKSTKVNAEYSSHKFVTAVTYDDILALDADAAENIEVTKTPTCQNEGEAVYKCINHTLEEGVICLHKETRALPTVECNMVIAEDECVDPTCTRGGYVQKYCEWCGKGERDYLAIEDDECVIVTDPATFETCTENGLTEKVYCSECGTVTTEAEIKPALGHEWDEEWHSNKTCVHFHECTRMLPCGKECEGESELVSFDKKETCMGDGYEGSLKCEHCDWEVKGTILKKTGHNFSAYKKDETKHWRECQNEGCTEIYGEGAHDSKVTIPAVPATCTSEGLSAGKKCSVCGYVTVKPTVTKRAEHTYSSIWKTDGTYHWKYCVNCNFAREKFNNKDHTFTISYNEDGHRYVCKQCGASSRVVEHTMGKQTVKTAARPFHPGEKQQMCETCDYTEITSYKLTFIECIKWYINFIMDSLLKLVGA